MRTGIRKVTVTCSRRLRKEKYQFHFQIVFGAHSAVGDRRNYVELSKLGDIELALLGHDTYRKEDWSAEDVLTLRNCWDEYQRRGEDMIALFRPAYSDVLMFHEIDGGIITGDDLRSLERAGAGIAADYRGIMRKVRAVEAVEETSQDAAGIQL